MAMANHHLLSGNPSTTARALQSSRRSHLTPGQKERSLVVFGTQNRRNHRPLIIRSASTGLHSTVGSGDNGATEPAWVLLERLFAKTQKIEEMMSKDPSISGDNKVSMSLQVLESDLQVVLSALRKKEEDLHEAEMRVLQELAMLKQTKQDVQRREQEIAAASAKQKQMEEDLKKAKGDLLSQSRQIKNLKLLVKEQSNDIANSQSSLSFKEDEMNKLQHELMKKNEEADIMTSELESMKQVLNEANKVVHEQSTKLQELQREVQEKENDLAESLRLRRIEEERLKTVEANLEKQTVEWLSAQEVLKTLAEQARKQMNDVNETNEDFKRVKGLLSDVRSELVSSQQSLASSRRKMDDQSLLLEKQVADLNEQKLQVMSYMENLKVAQQEVKSERIKLREANAHCEELKSQLSAGKELVGQLQEELLRERASLEQRAQEITLLQKELQRKQFEYSDTHSLLQAKDSELVEARLKIQQLKIEQASVQLILQDKDVNLLNAQKKLDEVNNEVAELQMLMNSKEEQLLQATTMLRDKEEHILSMQHELDVTKLNFSEAVSVIEQITQLTNKLVSVKDKDTSINLETLNEAGTMPDVMQKEMESELEAVKELLKEKEVDLITAQRALAVKDEQLASLAKRIEKAEKEVTERKKELSQDADGLKKLYGLAQERIGDRSIGDLAIEQLQAEAARLEAEAATSALKRISDLTSRLLRDTDTVILEVSDDSSGLPSDGKIEGLAMAEKEVVRLLNLTEQLVKEAGLSSTTEVQQQQCVHATKL